MSEIRLVGAGMAAQPNMKNGLAGKRKAFVLVGACCKRMGAVDVDKKLTEKQKWFIDHYIELGNATEAACQAGYRGKNLNRIGAENLSKLDIAIQERLAAKEDARIAKQDEVLRYLTEVMRGEVTEEAVVVESCGDGISEARTLEKFVGAKDRIKAAELLGKRYALFTDKLDINTPITLVIQNDYGD